MYQDNHWLFYALGHIQAKQQAIQMLYQKYHFQASNQKLLELLITNQQRMISEMNYLTRRNWLNWGKR